LDKQTGNLFVSRYMYALGTEILQITPAGAVSVYASNIPKPAGLAIDGQGNLFVANYSCPGGTVSKITRDGSVSTFATGLCRPDGLVFGPNGDLFIGDRGTNQVMRTPANGGQATVFARGFENPVGLTFDQTGR